MPEAPLTRYDDDLLFQTKRPIILRRKRVLDLPTPPLVHNFPTRSHDNPPEPSSSGVRWLSSNITATFPCFELLTSAYLVTMLSTAECERVFSRLKLIKTALRNRLSQGTLEKLLHIALNGPATLEELNSSGILRLALTYFFPLKNRNVKPPAKYIDMGIMRKLDKLR